MTCCYFCSFYGIWSFCIVTAALSFSQDSAEASSCFLALLAPSSSHFVLLWSPKSAFSASSADTVVLLASPFFLFSSFTIPDSVTPSSLHFHCRHLSLFSHLPPFIPQKRLGTLHVQVQHNDRMWRVCVCCGYMCVLRPASTCMIPC